MEEGRQRYRWPDKTDRPEQEGKGAMKARRSAETCL